MLRINEIIDAVRNYHPGADVTSIMKAYVYSAKVHAGQVRKSGEPYLSHPLAVAAHLAELRLDVASVCAGLLHDAVEDTPTTKEDIEDLLGLEVAALVDGVTKITLLDANTRTKSQAETFRKMILAMATDIRVLLIKLADRLHNMKTLGYLPENKQQRIARETRDIYAPMAHRLGIRRWVVELEDLSFYYLEPDDYQKIKEAVATRKSERQKFINEVKSELNASLQEFSISGDIKGRPKHFYSIYKKMNRQRVDIDGLFDLLAFRIVVKELKDCYEALGVIHNKWKPIPGRFRDYIGMPKANMYQSLHTSVVGPMGQRMEVQIRTEEMHRIAEEGIAAHWRYKDEGGGSDSEQDRFAWLMRLSEWVRDTKDPSEFMQSLRLDLYPDEIFVFTPGGEVKELPKGATPIDFAYTIHTEVGHTCVGAKVNGRMVPLRSQLNTGDQVAITTQKGHTPSKDWLNFVVTSRARSKIKAFIREQERAQAVVLGRDLLDREFRKHNLTLAATIREGKLDPVLESFSYKDPDLLLAAIAYGKISPRLVVNRLQPKDQEEKKERQSFIKRSLNAFRKRPHDGIKVKGVDDILVRYAKCCDPLPGDPIVGYITRGRGVTIHTKSCKHIDTIDPERLVDVEWDQAEDALHQVRIKITSSGQAGTLADVAAVLKKREVNILEADIRTSEDQKGISRFLIQVHDIHQLTQVLRELKRIKNVYQVSREIHN
jgi:guanosine-3',5'-bis(diphosphate) 3'-pyrophosphohydrolase